MPAQNTVPFAPESLNVTATTATAKIFEGKALSVSGTNSRGPFDILPMHENFISLIKEKIIIAGSTGQKREIACENGLLEVSENRVRIFIFG